MTAPAAEFPRTDRNVPSRYPDRATYDRDAAHQLLDEVFVSDVAFVVDGEPRVLPTLFVRVGDVVYLHGSVAATPALAARAADGGLPVCFTVTSLDGLVLARSQNNHSANYRSLIAHGVARMVTDEDAKRSAMVALVEKVGRGRSAHTRPASVKELARTAVFELRLDDVSVKRRTHGVVDEEADLSLPYWAGIVPMQLARGFAVPAEGVTAPPPDYLRARSPYLDPVVLRGDHVVLEPLRVEDAAELFTALDDPEVWRHTPTPRPASPEVHAAQIAATLAKNETGQMTSWITRDARTGEVVGTSSFHDIWIERRTVAIGSTQVARSRWRTAVNTEAKLLMMTHAFETLGTGRVEWHTDIRNERSQAAIERLGAVREGVLRRHKPRADGTYRDTVLYAMIAEDWPDARDRLAARLRAGHTG